MINPPHFTSLFVARLARLMPAVLVLLFATCAPTIAHALSIRIDDSSDSLTVTSDSATTQIVTGTGKTITDIFGNEFSVPGPSEGGGSLTTVVVEWAAITDPALVSPPDGTTFPEDVFVLESATTISDFLDESADANFHTLLFVSDVEGQPPFGIPTTICAMGPVCLSETDGFVEVASILYPGVANLSIQFRSDLDETAPEPATLTLVACGLLAVAGAGWWRQSHRSRRSGHHI